MTDSDYCQTDQLVRNRPKCADQWIAILGSAIPVAMVLGVVVFEFFVGLTGLVWLVTRMISSTRPHGKIMRHPLFWPLSIWFLTIVASRLINGGSAHDFANDIVFIRYPLFVAAMVDIASRFPVRRYLMIGLMIGVAYAGLNFLSAYLLGYDLLGKPLARYLGKLKEGARICALCAYAAPMLLISAIIDPSSDKGWRYWNVGLGITAITLLIGTGVRTALIAALIGGLATGLSLLVIRKRLNLRIILSIFVVAGLGLGWIVWFQPSMTSLYDRFYIWKVSFDAWLQNPLFGVGVSSFGDAFRQVSQSGIVPPVVSPTGRIFHIASANHAHNIFLQLMVCNGLLGLGAFLWTFIKTTLIAWRLGPGRHGGLLCWSFVLVTIGLTGWNIYDPFYATLVFFFMAIIGVSTGDGDRVETA